MVFGLVLFVFPFGCLGRYIGISPLSRQINRGLSFSLQASAFMRCVVCNVRGQRISIRITISFLRTLHTRVSFNGRLRLCLHAFRTMTLTCRNSRNTITKRITMAHCRRITRVCQIMRAAISEISNDRRTVRLLCNIQRRCHLRIIAVLRAAASAYYGDVRIFRCQ